MAPDRNRQNKGPRGAEQEGQTEHSLVSLDARQLRTEELAVSKYLKGWRKDG